MNNNRFTELLNLYLDDKATAEEREQLMQLIRDGSHDEMLKDRIDAMLLKGPVRADMDPQRARKMLKRILATAHERRRNFPRWPGARTWRWIATAAILLIALSPAWWIFRVDRVPRQQVVLQQERPDPVIFSGKQFVHLPDGSTVLLNDHTQLTYSASFGKQTREVSLTGEAYFDVRHDPSKPFKVVTGKITTTVLGTMFNVKAYSGQQEIKVTVTRGRVEVGDSERTFGIITPNQQMAVNTLTNDFVRTDLKAETVAAWKSEYLILDDVSLEEAAKTIAAKYKVKIVLANDKLKKCRISATFLNGEDLDQVLTVVSGVVQATYSVEPGGNVRITGNGCE